MCRLSKRDQSQMRVHAVRCCGDGNKSPSWAEFLEPDLISLIETWPETRHEVQLPTELRCPIRLDQKKIKTMMCSSSEESSRKFYIKNSKIFGPTRSGLSRVEFSGISAL